MPEPAAIVGAVSAAAGVAKNFGNEIAVTARVGGNGVRWFFTLMSLFFFVPVASIITAGILAFGLGGRWWMIPICAVPIFYVWGFVAIGRNRRRRNEVALERYRITQEAQKAAEAAKLQAIQATATVDPPQLTDGDEGGRLKAITSAAVPHAVEVAAHVAKRLMR